MHGRISALACDTYGSHVVQKAVDLIEGFDLTVVAEYVYCRSQLKAFQLTSSHDRISRNSKTLVKYARNASPTALSVG